MGWWQDEWIDGWMRDGGAGSGTQAETDGPFTVSAGSVNLPAQHSPGSRTHTSTLAGGRAGGHTAEDTGCLFA